MEVCSVCVVYFDSFEMSDSVMKHETYQVKLTWILSNFGLKILNFNIFIYTVIVLKVLT